VFGWFQNWVAAKNQFDRYGRACRENAREVEVGPSVAGVLRDYGVISHSPFEGVIPNGADASEQF
jgi:hypothetical protein